MKNIKIYNTRQAQKDLKAGTVTGLEAAIKKWKSILDVIVELKNEALSSCGLCLTHELCKECPTADCGDLAVMKDAMRYLKSTHNSIVHLIEFLEEKKP